MKKVRSTVIPIAITLVLLLLIEIFLRIFFPAKMDSKNQVSAFRHHPEYLVSLKPSVEKRYIRSNKNGGDTIYWKTNRHAFRGEELKLEDVRIMVYGDSNIHARFSSLTNTFPWYLEKYINEACEASVEVINAGVVGFGPDQSLLKFMAERDKFKPDIVVLQVFADNDYGDIVRNKLFKVDENGNLVRTERKIEIDPKLKEYIDRSKPWGYLRIMDATRKVSRSIKNENYDKIDADRMISLCTALCQEEFKSYIGEDTKVHSHFADHYDIDVATEPLSEISKKKILLMENVLKKFSETALQYGIRLLVIIEPSVVDISTNSYMNYNDLLNRFPGYRQKNLTKFIEESCEKHRIKYINLYDVFSKYNPEQYYFTDGNDHWNDIAQEKAARVTSNYLIKTLCQ